ncbi:maleylpyruvate isomerase family mycothiol-dependent enzyme [Nocardia brasiliensis]
MEFDELDLSERLRLARRGTAYLARHLAELRDDRFNEATLLPGWSRRHLIAHTGYNAAALCRLLDWASTGVETPMYTCAEQRGAEIEQGATLRPDALRNLLQHTASRLDQKWQNLPAPAWTATVRTAQGRSVPAAETVWMRTREVWIHAVDLDNGARFDDFPAPVLESLLGDVVASWRRRKVGGGIVLIADGREIVVEPSSTVASRVSGSLPALVRWATGRGAIGLHTSGPLPNAPRWL